MSSTNSWVLPTVSFGAALEFLDGFGEVALEGANVDIGHHGIDVLSC